MRREKGVEGGASEGAEGDVCVGARKSIRKGSFGVELKSRWRSKKVRFKLRLWKGKEGSQRGLGWDRRALGSFSMVWLFVLRTWDLVNGKESGGKVGGPTLWCGIKIRGGGAGVFSSIRGCGPRKQKVLHLYSKRKRSEGWLGFNGGDAMAIGFY